ncbi:MAG: FMN-binding protein [Lachnospiraceae bacterium]|nr:FMN-binding protein [Lachnospiraceae bacterium]
MKDWKDKIKVLLNVLPACLVVVVVGVSLKDYDQPVYEVKAAKSIERFVQTEKEVPDNSINFDDVEIELPPTKASSSKSSKATKTIKHSKEAKGYKNGTYYGVGNGFAGEIKVKVLVKKNKIKEIKIVESNDGSSYISSASSLLKKIIKTQSTNVDTVSGATYSSVGLIEAVRDALKDAGLSKKSNKKKEKKSNSKTDKNEKTTNESDNKNVNEKETVIPEGKVPYKDGVYYGTGEGYKGDITVAVTISNQTIKEIVVTNSSDDEAFFSKAKTLLNTILSKQSTDVDTVSGATFSSRGLIEAVNEALLQAKKATENVDDTPEKNEENNPDTTEEIRETQIKYKDGTYTTAVLCNPDDDNDFLPYTLSVTLTIKNNFVESISDIYQVECEDGEDNSWYIDRAVNGTKKNPGILSQIVQKNDADKIDAVSGATCSSNAIISALKELLKNAKTDAENQEGL